MRADEAGLESLDLSDVVGARLERLAADPVVEAREDVCIHVVALVDACTEFRVGSLRLLLERSTRENTAAESSPVSHKHKQSQSLRIAGQESQVSVSLMDYQKPQSSQSRGVRIGAVRASNYSCGGSGDYLPLPLLARVHPRVTSESDATPHAVRLTLPPRVNARASTSTSTGSRINARRRRRRRHRLRHRHRQRHQYTSAGES